MFFGIFFVLFTNLNLSSAQNKKIERYKDSVNTASNDSLKVHYLIKLSREIHRKAHDTKKEYTYANEAVELALQLNDPLNYAKALDNLGLLHRYHEDYTHAIDLHSRAFELVEDNDVPYINLMIFANNDGVAARYNQNYDVAVNFYLKALKLAEEENNLKNIAISCNGLGNTLAHIPGREQETIAYFERSLQAEKDRGNSLGVAMNYLSIGDFYTKQMEFDQAKKYLYELLAINQEREDVFGLAITEEFLGIAYLSEENDIQQAISYFEASLKKFNQLNNLHKKGELFSLLGEAYLKTNQPRTAQAYFEKSLDLAQKNQQLGLIKNNAYTLSEMNEEAGNISAAFQLYKTAKAAEDSLQMNEQRVKIEALTGSFNLEKKENEIELLEKEKALKEALVSSQEEQLEKR